MKEINYKKFVGKITLCCFGFVQAQEEKTATGQKTSDFRNRFEKFGGTPRPVRKQSLPSIGSAALSDTTEKSDWVGEIQRQMTETEKARLKDREELLEKLERQKLDFELKLEAYKETSKMVIFTYIHWGY